jgi:hypothetical protein
MFSIDASTASVRSTAHAPVTVIAAGTGGVDADQAGTARSSPAPQLVMARVARWTPKRCCAWVGRASRTT